MLRQEEARLDNKAHNKSLSLLACRTLPDQKGAIPTWCQSKPSTFELYRNGFFRRNRATDTDGDQAITMRIFSTSLLKLKSGFLFNKKEEIIRVRNTLNHRIKLTQQFIHNQVPYK